MRAGNKVSAVSSPIVGVVGAGQLARMMQQAAIGLGVPLRLLAEAADGAAAQVIVDTTVGDYTDWDTLSSWAKGAHVVTFDHEHVPTEHLQRLMADGIACRPGPAALIHAQDKAVMRKRLAQLDVAQPRFRLLDSFGQGAANVSSVAESLGGFPLVLKTTRGGYDGKGVWLVADEAQAEAVLAQAPRGVQFLAEERVDFSRELSALVARSPSGQVAAYPVVESVQRDGVCVEVTAPAPDLDPQLAVTAQQTAMRIAAELGVDGVLAVELFQTRDGARSGQRAGDATAQHRTLVDRRRRHQPVREPPARRSRPAAGLSGGAQPMDGDGQHPRRCR